MSELTVIDADCEANGHPTECSEPAPGTVQKDNSHGITVTVNGTTKEIATVATATMNFPSHAHDHSTLEGCHQNQSHSLDPDTGEPSITINGSPIYQVGVDVTTDPTTGGNVDIVSNPFATGITKTP